MIKVGILGNKGGTGKTMLAVHLTYAVSRYDKVLFVDTDYAQGSGLNWLLGRDKQHKPYTLFTKNNVSGYLIGKNVVEGFEGLLGVDKDFKYVIVDGRPEPLVTAEVLRYVMNGAIIAPVDISADTIKQVRDLYNAIEKENVNVRKYIVVNKMTQSRISQQLLREIDEMGFNMISVLSYAEYMKWAEKENKPIWQIKGSGRVKHSDVLKEIGYWIVQGRL